MSLRDTKSRRGLQKLCMHMVASKTRALAIAGTPAAALTPVIAGIPAKIRKLAAARKAVAAGIATWKVQVTANTAPKAVTFAEESTNNSRHTSSSSRDTDNKEIPAASRIPAT